MTIFVFLDIIDAYIKKGVEEKIWIHWSLSYSSYLTNTTNHLSLIWAIVVLLLGSAFFSAVETALTCCNRVRMKVKAEDGKKVQS